MRLCKSLCTIVLIAQFLPLVFTAIPPKAVKASSGIVISEIAWAGSSLSQADEWIELYNPTDIEISVGGWYLTGCGSSGKNIVLPNDAIIKAHKTFLIANYNTDDEKTALVIQADVTTSTLSVSNSSMLIELKDQVGEIIDVAGDGGTPLAGASEEFKISMQRVGIFLAGNSKEAWISASASSNLSTSDLGSPGKYVDHTPEPSNQGSTDEQMANEVMATGTEVVLEEQMVDTPTSTTGMIDYETSSTVPVTTSSTEEILIEATSTLQIIVNENASSTDTKLNTTSINPTDVAKVDMTDVLLTKKYKSLIINEVMAAPEEGKEWVEIYNTSVDWIIDLGGVEIHDSVGKIAVLEGEIEPLSYKVFYISSSRLNNSGDSVKLYPPESGELLDTLTYLAMQKGMPYARDDQGNWRETLKPTPGDKNIIEEKITESTDSIDTSETNSVDGDLKTESETVQSATQNNESDNLQKTTLSTTTCLPMINEILPNPEKDQEWIEIACISTSTQSVLEYEIHDATGKIAVFKNNFTNDFVIIKLNSARLNNSGDVVKILDVNGNVIDQFSYSESKSAHSWSKQMDGNWILSNQPTPGYMNTEVTADDLEQSDAFIDADKIITLKKSTENKSLTTNNIYLITHDMINDAEYGGLRVALEGMVGSPLKHTTGRSFVLLNHEGKGLLVKVPSRLKQPEMGKWLKITGTLKFDTNDLPYLSLGTKDGWIEQDLEETVVLREVYLPAPAAEDAWSYVSATATVQSVSGKTIHLISQDADIDMKIRPSVSYRASRLSKGDEISISGILDMSGEIPTILPRNANEILILSHAEVWSDDNQKKEEGLPGWTPFGAAAIAIGALEGVKVAKKSYKNKNKVIQKNRQPV
ncbi:lamin tail domain-containing protein [Patescibacteria group bacterium]|nr:lamin tail domain-containing protein [Patescibacteria group bacterium]